VSPVLVVNTTSALAIFAYLLLLQLFFTQFTLVLGLAKGTEVIRPRLNMLLFQQGKWSFAICKTNDQSLMTNNNLHYPNLGSEPVSPQSGM
jgi:hypothetical protein